MIVREVGLMRTRKLRKIETILKIAKVSGKVVFKAVFLATLFI